MGGDNWINEDSIGVLHLPIDSDGLSWEEEMKMWKGVTIVEFAPDIVTTLDGEVRKQFQRSLEKQGMKFKIKTKVVGVDTSGNGVKMTLKPASGRVLKLTLYLSLPAMSRSPLGLGLRRLELKWTSRVGSWSMSVLPLTFLETMLLGMCGAHDGAQG